ncbi:MAG: hypothetical protein AAF684_07325, partial [Pseudomonadota bacterium]
LPTAVAAACGPGQILLRQIDGATYRSAKSAGGSIGGHVRHLVNFFECLVKQGPTGRIDYDLRERRPEVETDPLAADQALSAIVAAFERGVLDAMPPVVEMRESLPGLDDRPWTASSPARETAFCVSHCVHHLALVRAAAETAGWTAPEGFGVAASTLRYKGAA